MLAESSKRFFAQKKEEMVEKMLAPNSQLLSSVRNDRIALTSHQNPISANWLEPLCPEMSSI
jgi:hypothetical protein